MRIARLDLLRYGRFTDRSLTFPERPVDLHLVCGPNEAGKSTALAAIEDLLFGVEHRTSFAFLHEASALRLGAILEGQGRRLEARRRKGNKQTLLGPDDKPLGEGALQPLLGAVDRPFFQRMFSLDHQRLRAGGRQILEGSDDVGRMLFEAGSGLSGLRGRLQSLEDEAEKIFAPRAAKDRTFYLAKGKFEEAEKRQREVTVSARAWLEVSRELGEVEARRQAAEEAQRRRKAARTRLERIRRVLPILRQLASTEEELTRLEDVAVLPADARAQLDGAERDLLMAEAELQAAAQEIARLDGELAKLPEREPLLGREEEIRQLDQGRSVAAKARQDLTRRIAERALHEQQIAALLKELGEGARTVAEAASILPARPAVARLRKLLEGRSGLEAAQGSARRQLAKLRGDAERLAAELDPPAAEAGGEALQAAIEAVRRRGDLGAEIRRGEADLDGLAGRIETALGELRPWAGTVEELEALRISDAAIEAARRELVEVAEARRRLDGERRQVERDLDEERRASQQIARSPGAVSPQELAAARLLRDRGWALVRRRHVDAAPVDDEELRSFAGATPLVERFEAAVRHADEIADRRFAGASESAQLGEALLRSERLEGRRAALGREAAALAAREEAAAAAWRARWSPFGLEAQPPEAMLEWSRRRSAALELAARERAGRGALERLRQEESATRRRLDQALAEAGPGAAPSPSSTLAEALVAGELRLRERAAAEVRRRERRDQLERLATQEAGARRELAEADAAVERWGAEWGEAVRKVGRDPHEPAEVTRAALEILEQLTTTVRESASLDERVRKMEQDVAAFEAQARALAGALGDLQELAPEAIAQALVERLEAAKARRTRRQTLEGQREAGEGKRALAEQQRLLARSRIDQLLGLGRCGDVEALRLAIGRAQLRDQRRAQLTDERRRLTEASDGLPRPQLEGEAAGADPDRLPGEVEELSAEIDRHDDALRQLGIEAAQARDRLRAIAGGDLALAFAEERQLAVSALREEAERYIRLRTASRVLRWAIDRHRREKQAPLLRRAAVLFTSLTGGAFADLVLDLDDQDRPFLAGVRGDRQRVEVDGMSDGSVDQLYLALRLAAIEEHLDGGRPLPLVADDLFINFDDGRAAAGLRVLAELARRTQVLFFTHHEHLLRIAEGALGGAELSVLRL